MSLPDGIAAIYAAHTLQRTRHPAQDDLYLAVDYLPFKAKAEIYLACDRAHAARGMRVTDAPLADRRHRLQTAKAALARAGGLIASAIERIDHDLAELEGKAETSTPEQAAPEKVTA